MKLPKTYVATQSHFVNNIILLMEQYEFNLDLNWQYTLFYIYIQGDSGGICTTLGNDSMSDSKQKSSYEHGSDFERLRSYGHF